MKSRFLVLLLCWLTTPAWAALDPALVRQLNGDDTDQKITAIQQIAKTPDGDALRLLQALSDGNLYAVGSGSQQSFYIQADDKALDALTGRPLAKVPDNGDNVSLNNRARGELDNTLAGLRLLDPDPDKRLAAAQELQSDVGPEMAPLLTQAVTREKDGKIRALLVQALAQANLNSPDAALRMQAVKDLAQSGSPDIRGLLLSRLDEGVETDPKVRAEVKFAIKSIDHRLAWGDNLGRIFTGISLGSILLLAALGLAITYGVMGVINMAHGELLMVGAYAAYFMQGFFQRHFPNAQDWYLLAAVPVAFFSAALIGMIMERTVIRWLYGRALETLLATWGLSLMLIQAARVIFGAQNVEVSNPSWMSGGIEVLPNLTLPWNRIAIIGFAFFVLFLVWLLMNKTRLGMFVRAVTQNRAMAGCVGVPTARIDTLAFGLGAGIAGLGGLALSQLANVGPDMGQGYIVDSFMVVVLGGVGQLAGAVWAALGLGIVSKFLEGWAGAVIAKIIVLVIVIIFIQKRPQGLFALKGRFVDN